MAEYLIQDTTLTGIGDKIRSVTGTTVAMSPAEMESDLQNFNNDLGTIATEQDSLIEQIMTALEGKSAVPSVEAVEVTIDSDMTRVYYVSPDTEDGSCSELLINGQQTITCLKNSIIVVTDCYATTSSSLEYLTSTTGEVIAPVMGNNNTKVRMVMASQSGTILLYGS